MQEQINKMEADIAEIKRYQAKQFTMQAEQYEVITGKISKNGVIQRIEKLETHRDGNNKLKWVGMGLFGVGFWKMWGKSILEYFPNFAS
jgi:hypothetical protein